MTIQDLGSIGELVAAIATVTTLGYLAFQIRQNTRATHAASHHAITDSMNQVNLSTARSPGLARIWVVGNKARSSLSEEERIQYDMLLLSYFHVFDTLHYEARVGAGDRDLLLAEERSFAHVFSLPGVQEWWAENPYAFSPEFRAYMEQFSTVTPDSDS